MHLQTSLAGPIPPCESVLLLQIPSLFLFVTLLNHSHVLYSGSFFFILKKKLSAGLSWHSDGALVGNEVGTEVGDADGRLVGDAVGLSEGVELTSTGADVGVVLILPLHH